MRDRCPIFQQSSDALVQGRAAHCELQAQFWIARGVQSQCLTFWVAACIGWRHERSTDSDNGYRGVGASARF
jgi:hypothetical protein